MEINDKKLCMCCNVVKDLCMFSRNQGKCKACRSFIAKEKYKLVAKPKHDKIEPTTKYVCECGGSYKHCHKSTHMKTTKHIAMMKSLNNVKPIESKIDPLQCNKYNYSKIYKLTNIVDDTFYIGSTASTLYQRFNIHKCAALNAPNKLTNRLYIHLNKIGFENVRIVLIKEYCFESKEQLLQEENKFIQMYKNEPNCLNTYMSV